MGASLTIRDWKDTDRLEIAKIHDQMALGYTLPEEFGPLFFIKKAVVDENDVVVAAATVKLVGESFLWVNPDFSTFSRTKSVKMLNDECSKAASAAGLEECSAWIPPKILKCFRRTLFRLGWRRSPWRNWTVILK